MKKRLMTMAQMIENGESERKEKGRERRKEEGWSNEETRRRKETMEAELELEVRKKRSTGDDARLDEERKE